MVQTKPNQGIVRRQWLGTDAVLSLESGHKSIYVWNFFLYRLLRCVHILLLDILLWRFFFDECFGSMSGSCCLIIQAMVWGWQADGRYCKQHTGRIPPRSLTRPNIYSNVANTNEMSPVQKRKSSRFHNEWLRHGMAFVLPGLVKKKWWKSLEPIEPGVSLD